MTKDELTEQIINDVISKIQPLVKEAFLKGYELGELQTALTVKVDGVEYVDLGLPSGTLWSKTPFKGNYSNSYARFCYDDAQKLNIPTKEQCEELLANKKNITSGSRVETVGANGQRLITYVSESYLGENCKSPNKFWIKGEPDSSHNAPVLTAYADNDGLYKVSSHFTGYRLPVFLVKSKSDI